MVEVGRDRIGYTDGVRYSIDVDVRGDLFGGLDDIDVSVVRDVDGDGPRRSDRVGHTVTVEVEELRLDRNIESLGIQEGFLDRAPSLCHRSAPSPCRLSVRATPPGPGTACSHSVEFVVAV